MNIIFTRPLIDSEDLMMNFFSSGHKVIHMPTLSIASANVEPINTKDYDGLIFTSANAVRFLKLNANDGISFASDVFAATADTSTVLNTKSDSATNASGDTYVIYCFSSVEGFSKFGSYTGYLPATGNGSFVYLGFRPAFLIVKKTASEFMLLTDSKRGAINPIDERLFPAYNFTESDEVVVDFVSNGFKARNGGGASIISGSGSGYVFFAFAESPFKNSRAR